MFFLSNAWLKLVKNSTMLSNTLRMNFCYLKIIHILHPKIIGNILKNKQNNCVCIHEIMRQIIMKMKMKIKILHIDTI